MESALVFKEEPQQTSTSLLSFNKADISIPNYNSKIGDNGKEIIIFNVKVDKCAYLTTGSNKRQVLDCN